MRTEDEWEDAVRKKLTGIEKNLPEGDWGEFLTKSKVGKKSTVKVLAITLSCCAAAATFAAVMMWHATSPEYDSTDLTRSLLAESTVRKPESSVNVINKERAIPETTPKRYYKNDIPEDHSKAATVSNKCGAEALDETCALPDGETTSSNICQQDCHVSTPEGPDSSHESEPNSFSLEQEDNNEWKRTDGHRVSISLLGAGVRGSSSDRIALGGNSYNDANAPDDLYEYTHKRPMTFGMAISYGLTPRVSIVTGLEYSRYKSSITLTKKNFSENQRVDYLGIPLGIDYQALKSNHFSVYTGAGVKADWCVKATYAGERLTDKGLNWTAYATIGAQYEILTGINVFFQPELSYYLNSDGHTLQTYRTENPLMVSAVLGLRLSLGN